MHFIIPSEGAETVTLSCSHRAMLCNAKARSDAVPVPGQWRFRCRGGAGAGGSAGSGSVAGAGGGAGADAYAGAKTRIDFHDFRFPFLNCIHSVHFVTSEKEGSLRDTIHSY